MADYEELIGAKFSFGDSLDQALAQYTQFIKSLNDKGLNLKIGVSDGALNGIAKQLQDVKAQLTDLSGAWKEVFGTGADAAEASTKDIKQSVAEAESAFIASQKNQTEAAQSASAKRIEIAEREAAAIKRTQEELKAKSPVHAEVSRYGSQFFQAELAKIEAEKQARLKTQVKDQFSGAQQYGAGVVEKELNRVQKEQERLAAAEQKAAERRQNALKNAPYRPSADEEREAARSSASKIVADEIARRDEHSGIGGFFSGVKSGLSPKGEGSAYNIGEFAAQAARFLAIYAAMRYAAEAAAAAIKAPFDIIKDGIQYLTEFQERASQLKATLLDHGFFSKDPAENLKLAGEAADALQAKIDDLAAKLHVKSETIQAAFETFSDYGGNKLTGNLNNSVELAGYATAALQSQNPRIQQRTVATQLQKLTAGTLTDTDKLPAALGISAEKLDAMAKGAKSTHDLLQQIEAEVPGLADRISNANDRFSALADSAKLVGQRIEGIVAKPVFDLLSQQLRALLDWVERNKTAIQEFAAQLGAAFASIENEFATLGREGAPLLVGALKNAIYNASTLLGIVGRLANVFNLISGKKTLGQVRSENQASLDEEADTRDLLYKSPDEAKKSRIARLNQRLTEKYRGNADADAYLKDYNAGLAKINSDYNSETNPGADASAAIAKYTPGGNIPNPKVKGNPEHDQISAIRETYQAEVDKVKKGGQAVRDAITEEARAFRISLVDAADYKEAAYIDETQRLKEAGDKAAAALAKVAAGKDPAKTANAKKSVLDRIDENNLDINNASAKSRTAGQDAISKQNDRLTEIGDNGEISRQVEAESYLFNVRQALHQKQLISDADFLDEEQRYWDRLYQIKLAGARKNEAAEDDPVKKLELHQKVLELTQQQSEQNQTLAQHKFEAPYDQTAREDQLRVERAQFDLQNQQIRTDVDRHAGLVDTARRDNLGVLRSNRGVLTAQSNQAFDELTRAEAEARRANPRLTDAQISALPGVQEKQLKFNSITAQIIKAQQMEVQTQGISKEEAADALFGAGSTNGHFQGEKDDPLHNFAQSVNSLGHIANNVSKGVGAIEQGYQQSGVGGAVGAGLGQVGQFIPGIGGQIVSGIGSIIGTVSQLFTQAAQEIGKEVAHAVDKVMEKYSTGQTTLNQTLASVQQQYNTLVAKETGRKGGQQVLDTEGVNLQQQIDQLKQQRQQIEENFADQTIVAGGTNSVASQWLQTWIDVNKQVQEYKNAVGDAASTQLVNQYLNEELDQERKSLQDQYIQGQSQAVSDALQYNQLLQQRNNYEDQYRQQVFQLQSQDSLARRGNPAEQTARQISLAKSQYNQQTQQLNFEIDTYKQKVDYETQIFGLAKTTAALQQQALSDQAYQLKEQVQQYQTIVALLASITGVTATNGQIPGLSGLGITTPDNYGVNNGGLNPIPGYGAPGTVDNSATTIQVTIPASELPANGTPDQYAKAIGNELAYAFRTKGIIPL